MPDDLNSIHRELGRLSGSLEAAMRRIDDVERYNRERLAAIEENIDRRLLDVERKMGDVTDGIERLREAITDANGRINGGWKVMTIAGGVVMGLGTIAYWIFTIADKMLHRGG